MADYAHTIMQQTLEIKVADNAQFQRLKETIVDLVADKVNAVLDDVFSQHVPDDVVITLERLEVDLKRLDWSTLEKELVAQTAQKLPPVVEEQVRSAVEDPQKRNVTPLPEAKLKAIEHYLLHGHFAWWMPRASQDAIEKMFTDLLSEAPDTVRGLLLQLQTNPNALQRLTTHFSAVTVQRTLHLLGIRNHDQFRALAEDLRLLQRQGHLTNSHVADFEQIVWSTLLSQAASPQATPNEQVLTQKTLAHVAQAMNISYEAIIVGLAQNVDHRKMKSQLPTLLPQLHEALATHTDTPKQPTLPQLIAHMDTLPPTASTQATTLLEQIVHQATPVEFRALMAGWLQTKHKAPLLAQLSTTHIAQLVATLQPSLTPAFEQVSHWWHKADRKEPREWLLQTLQYITHPPSPTPEAYLQHIAAAIRTWLPDTTPLDQMLRSAWEEQLKSYLTQSTIPPGYANEAAYKAQIINSLQEQDKADTLRAMLADKAWHTRLHTRWQNAELTTLLQQLDAQTAEAHTTDAAEAPPLTAHPLIAGLQHHLIASQHTPQAQSALYQALQEALNTPKTTRKQHKAIADALRTLLTNTEQAPETVQAIAERIAHWTATFSDEADSTTRQQQATHLAQSIETLFSALPTSEEIHDYIAQGTWPQRYKGPNDFVEAILPLHTALIAQLHIAPFSAARTPPLIEALAPLPPTLLQAYQTSLLKADILRQGTIPEKQKALYTHMLTTLGQTTDPTLFIHLTLLKISQQTPIAKQELLRRLNLVATLPLANTLQQLAPALAADAPADVVEVNLLPTAHQTLSPNLLPQYHTQLLPHLQQQLQKNITPETLHEQIAKQIANTWPHLADYEQHTLHKAFVQTAQHTLRTQQQATEAAWNHFVHTGTVSAPHTTPHTLLEAWISTTPTAQQALQTLVQTPHIRKRLIAHLSAQDLTKIITTIGQPSHTPLAEQIHHAWDHTGTLTTSTQAVRHAWWEAVLHTLPHPTAAQTWLSQSLTHTAQTLAIAPHTLLTSLATVVQDQPLSQLLTNLQHDWHSSTRTAAPNRQPLPALQHLLSKGLLALADNQSTALRQLEGQLQQTLDTQPEAIKNLLMAQENKPQTARRLAYYFSHPLVQRIIQLWRKPPQPAPTPDTTDPFTTQKQHETAILTQLLTQKDINTPPPTEDAPPPTEDTPPPAPPLEEISIQIHNGGLALLWPHLEDLLRAQGLLRRDRFASILAQNNAVHTLQYLVTEKRETPEWHLTLNKILCGIPYDAVVAPGYQTTAEKEGAAAQEIAQLHKNCHNVLQRILEQWEELKNLKRTDDYKDGMTPQALQEYFLQRNCLLRHIQAPEFSYWHLTIPLREYDTRDLLPPWSLQTVHLPWMKEDLVTFWMPD